jgi:hypothetical protein
LVAVGLQVLPWQRVFRGTVAQIRNTEFFRVVLRIPAAESDKTKLDLASYRQTSVEAGSNTSTVTLRVVGGDEEEGLESVTVKYDHETHGTRTRK